MTELHRFTSVRCPFDRVPDLLFAFLEEHGARAGERAVLELRAMIGELVIERDVTLSAVAKPAFPGYERLALEWAPRDRGPYPSFRGSLTAQDEGAGFCRLDLDGTYEPPFGPLGAAFDAALGRRIAADTVEELLWRFKVALESALFIERLPLPTPPAST